MKQPVYLGESSITGRGRTSLGLQVAFFVVPLIFVILRIIARWMQKRSFKAFGWDDWAMITGMFVSGVGSVASLVGFRYGFGKHIEHIKPSNIPVGLHHYILQVFFHPTAMFFIKLSVALFLLQLGGLQKWMRRALIWTIAFLCISTLTVIIILCVQCRPIQKNWRIDTPGKCLSPAALIAVVYIEIGLIAITDLICVLLPFPIIWNLNVPERTKLSLLGVMCLGVFVVICPIIELTKVQEFAKKEDILYSTTPLASWNISERGLAIIAACIPPTRSLWVRVFAKKRDPGAPPNKPRQANKLWTPPSADSHRKFGFLSKLLSKGSQMDNSIEHGGLRDDQAPPTRDTEEDCRRERVAGRGVNAAWMPLDLLDCAERGIGILRTTDVEVTTHHHSDPWMEHELE